eukprot:GHVS01052855.1.p1 GENE.GHVS01052855.1~~GHVS01052855.1.p1  ORF type:complete len:1096 (-),score=62.88 GHVS01052855.1:625-3912(-)
MGGTAKVISTIRTLFDVFVLFLFLGSISVVVFLANTFYVTLLRIVPFVIGVLGFFSVCTLLELIHSGFSIVHRKSDSWLACRSFKTGLRRKQNGHFEEDADLLQSRQLEQFLIEQETDKFARKQLRWRRQVLPVRVAVNVAEGLRRGRIRIGSLGRKRSFELAAIAWNCLLSFSWVLATFWWRRDDIDTSWDFSAVPIPIYVVQDTLLSGATIQFIISYLAQAELLPFLKSLCTWVDILTLPPLGILISATSSSDFIHDLATADSLLLLGFLRLLKTFVSVRHVITQRVPFGSATQAQFFVLVAGIFFLLASFSAAMFTAQGVNPYILPSNTSRIGYSIEQHFGFFYFAIVTMSTVGYGDIQPENFWSRLFTMLFILGSLLWLPLELNRLLETLSDRSSTYGALPFSSKWVHSPYAVLCGDVEPEHLSTLIAEIAACRGYVSARKIVVMSRRFYDEFAVQIRLATSLRVSLCLVHGDCGTGGDAADVDKVQPDLAEIAYLVSGRQTDDRKTLKTQGAADIVHSIGCANSVVLSDLKFSLLLRTLTDCPGAITLVANLSSSTPRTVPSVNNTQEVSEYVYGAGARLFSFQAPDCLFGYSFLDVAWFLYTKGFIVLIGVYTRADGFTRGVTCCKPFFRGPQCRIARSGAFVGERENEVYGNFLLNPSTESEVYCVRPGDRLVIISSSVDSAHYLEEAKSLPFDDVALIERRKRTSTANNHNTSRDNHICGGSSGPRKCCYESCEPKATETAKLVENGPPTLGSPGTFHYHFVVESHSQAYDAVWADPSRPLLMICGWPGNLHLFLRKLQHLEGWNVVILASQVPPPWSSMRLVSPYADFVAVIKGKALLDVTLTRSGALVAKRVIVFPVMLDSEHNEVTSDDRDRNAIEVQLKLKHIRSTNYKTRELSEDGRYHPSSSTDCDSSDGGGDHDPILPRSLSDDISSDERVLIELSNAKNICFLDSHEWRRPNSDRSLFANGEYFDSPEFMGGSVFCDMMLYSALLSNPKLSRFGITYNVVQALARAPTHDTSGVAVHPVDEELVGATYQKLFEHCIATAGAVPVGLWRRNRDCRPYVYTNPLPSTVIRSSDKLFLIQME